MSAGAYASTGSAPLAAGCFAGPFLIDFDHYLDYIVFERQWRQPRSKNFLRYYFTGMPQRVVLPLHSIELMMALAALCYLSPHPLLNGYLLGAAMRLLFDILVNGGHVLRMPVLFYSFAYRAFHGFSAAALMDPVTVSSEAGARPWRDFLFQMAPYNTKTHQRGVGKGNGARPIISIGVLEGWLERRQGRHPRMKINTDVDFLLALTSGRDVRRHHHRPYDRRLRQIHGRLRLRHHDYGAAPSGGLR